MLDNKFSNANQTQTADYNL